MLFKITRLLRGKSCCLHVSRIFLFQDGKKKEEFASGGHQQQNEMDTERDISQTKINTHRKRKISFRCNRNSRCRTLSPSKSPEVRQRTKKEGKKNAQCEKIVMKKRRR